jgi:hypothetical protein
LRRPFGADGRRRRAAARAPAASMTNSRGSRRRREHRPRGRDAPPPTSHLREMCSCAARAPLRTALAHAEAPRRRTIGEWRRPRAIWKRRPLTFPIRARISSPAASPGQQLGDALRTLQADGFAPASRATPPSFCGFLKTPWRTTAGGALAPPYPASVSLLIARSPAPARLSKLNTSVSLAASRMASQALA